MKHGHFSEYFDGIAAKRLSAVESDPERSRQHEFAAVRRMINITGQASEPTPVPARFVYLSDDDSIPIVEDADLTLYDCRRKKEHRGPEYRFYFVTNAVTKSMSPGDLLVVAKLKRGGLLVVIAKDGSTIASQLEWLFGLDSEALLKQSKGSRKERRRFAFRDDFDSTGDKVAITSALILEAIGIEAEVSDESALEAMLKEFGQSWPPPPTREFSAFARSVTHGVDPVRDPDAALLAWVDREYVLYRTLEKHHITARLDAGFGGDSSVEDFLQFSLSVQNRRKSRSGSSFENHIEAILKANGVKYARGAKTEFKSKPDFLFPGIDQYRNAEFPVSQLHMLASKRSVKDRWRQILAEAERIPVKHLLTMEAAISGHQTDEMFRQKVQLVSPKPLHHTFTAAQREQLLSVKQLVALLKLAKSPEWVRE